MRRPTTTNILPLRRAAPDWAPRADLDQLLELLIGDTCLPALRRAGGFASLMRQVHALDLDDVTRTRLLAFAELTLRLYRDRAPWRAPITKPAQAAQLFASLALLDHEEMWAAFLSASHRPLAVERLAEGGTCSVEFHSSALFRHAVLFGATALVVCHNHPSGDPKPSEADRALTHSLTDVARTLGFRVLDHVIIGAGGCTYSFSDAHFGQLDPATLSHTPTTTP